MFTKAASRNQAGCLELRCLTAACRLQDGGSAGHNFTPCCVRPLRVAVLDAGLAYCAPFMQAPPDSDGRRKVYLRALITL